MAFGRHDMYFGSQRVGMATVLVFFAVGGILLLPVQVPRDGRRAEQEAALAK